MFRVVLICGFWLCVCAPLWAQQMVTLEDCLKAALLDHPAYRSAQQAELQKQMEVKAAWRELWPQVDLKYSHSQGELNADFFGESYHATLTQPLYQGGALTATVRQKRAEHHIALWRMDAVRSQIKFDVKKLYFRFLALRQWQQELVHISEQLSQLKNRVAQQFYAKLIPRMIYREAFLIVQKAQLQHEVTALKCAAAQELLHLKVWGDYQVKHDISPFSEQQRMPSLMELQDKVLKNNLSLKIAELDVAAAEQDMIVRRALNKPKISLSSSLGEGGEDEQRSTLELTKEWTVGVVVEMPFWGHGLSYHFDREEKAPAISRTQSTQKAEHMVQLSLFDQWGHRASGLEGQSLYASKQDELKDLRHNLLAQVKEAYLAMVESKKELEIAQKEREFYQTVLQIEQLKSAEQEVNLIPVLHTWEKLLQVQKAYWEFWEKYYVALSELEYLAW